MKNIFNKAFLGLGIVFMFFVSCETTNLDLLDDPNNLDPSRVSINDGVNQLQIDLKNFFEGDGDNFPAVAGGIQIVGGGLTRINYMFGTTYENAVAPNTGAGSWNVAYANILLDSKVILDNINSNQINAPLHEGVIKVINAYTLFTLVDYWGDVPYSEALQGADNLNPRVDSGSDVYNVALGLLDEAIVNFDEALSSLDTDGNVINNIPGGGTVLNMFFENAATEGDLALNWKKFASSLKFKAYLNLGNTAELNNLIADGNLISSNFDSCAFRYNTVNNPESRHPLYVTNYGDGQPNNYMSNSLMYKMVPHIDNLNPDPRAPFYFYRQTLSFPAPNDNPSLVDALPCSVQASPYPLGVVYCSFGDGYWGRDHGNSEGIPPDTNLRTTFGAYPIGGRFDDGSASSVGDQDGMNGAGISPILMSFQMDLMRAEAALRLGTTDDPASLLASAIDKSISYVTSFTGNAPLDPTTYSGNVMADYMAADNMGKLNIVAEQMWIASFGSGTEMYNMYRRTGMPNNLQPHLFGSGAGPFPRSIFYTLNTANMNSSINQKPDLTTSVFWADSSISLY